MNQKGITLMIKWTKVTPDTQPPHNTRILVWITRKKWRDWRVCTAEDWSDVCDLEDILYFCVINDPEKLEELENEHGI